MDIQKIPNLENILILEDNQTVVDHTLSPLTSPGENYGSLMLRLHAVLDTPQGTEDFYAVAKMIPPNEFLQSIFNTKVTFKNEIAFYKKIVPVLQDFQRQQGTENIINYFPKYWGSRINQTGSSEVDSDAVLILENLTHKGFNNVDRKQGFDLQTSKVILEDLAHFHAVPIALKLKSPDVFENEVKPHLTPFTFRGYRQLAPVFFKLIDTIDQLRMYKTRARKPFENLNVEIETREPFATISHNDCWVNNIMIKTERGKCVDNKLIDFQIFDYASPAQDLIFFLFSSVQTQVLERHYDILVQHYHQTFIAVLKQLKCDTSRFSFGALSKEMNYEGKNSQFTHLILMTFPMFAQNTKELTELSKDNIFEFEDPISEVHKDKIIFIVREFAKRNWI